MPPRRKMSERARIGVWIPRQQRDLLEADFKRYGTPISETVRRALALYYAQREKKA
jgi:hypothetical protein